ncbi:hypothetical protein B296_00031653 [Ensete ventricosum]|uniref:Uncharacterized protein n=1 Tax=Ensete ventricosum TaxID=4639 RepID=A0A426Y0F8_ENSVE|nr:hypothetical protein B296_00031653 [Ensete ventricosum]
MRNPIAKTRESTLTTRKREKRSVLDAPNSPNDRTKKIKKPQTEESGIPDPPPMRARGPAMVAAPAAAALPTHLASHESSIAARPLSPLLLLPRYLSPTTGEPKNKREEEETRGRLQQGGIDRGNRQQGKNEIFLSLSSILTTVPSAPILRSLLGG